MVGTSLWDYLFIRICIFFLRMVAPLSVIYSFVSLLVSLPFQLPWILQGWLTLEAIFYLAAYLPYKQYLQRAARHPIPPCRDDRRELFWRCHSNIPDPVLYLRKWFRDAPEEEIKLENIKEFFRWAFLNTGQHDPAYDDEVEEYVGEMERLLGRKFMPGRGDAKCLRLTLDKVEMSHRSLIWYLCVFVVDTITSFFLLYYNFNFHRTSIWQFFTTFPWRPFTLFSTYSSSAKTLTYWHRPHTSKTKLPILFIHGIGIGLYPYINFLADLNDRASNDPSDDQVGIIAVEILSIWRKPSLANEYLLSYFGSKDIGVSHTLFRRFFWADNLLWKEDIQDRPVTVVLAGKDIVIDTKSIRAYLTGSDNWALGTGNRTRGTRESNELEVLWFPNLDHGQVFDEKSTRNRLVEIVRRLCKENIN
ncbi:hypothetical protein S40288_07597 [Stachybotrys chartarum IBT 40288]|nr:hypothetical protein S40288_07597 [Stachybotrys chartarum IBT 40288]